MGSIFFIVTSLCLGPVFSSPLLISKETRNREDGLGIVNSNFTSISKYPCDAAFLIANDIWGAGCIVDKLWVLTLAFNCLWVDPSYITIRVGSGNWSKGGVLIPVEKCIMHPNYTGTWANNIALVKLTKEISFGKKSQPAFYNVPDSLSVPNATYDVSGWGIRSATNYVKETQLQKINQTILSAEECSKYYNLTAATGSFCARNPDGGPCVFDFGAPMNKKNYAVGMYQGSTDCRKPATYPALYVDVFSYIDWIVFVVTGQQTL